MVFSPRLSGRAAVECGVEIGAPCQEVFDAIHDYGIRLCWDTLLSGACIVDGSEQAGLEVRTLCVGRSAAAGVGMETVYISFDQPRVAAVRMERGPWFIAEFAAGIRHTALAPSAANRSRVIYKFQISARPRWLGAVLDPLLRSIFQRQTRKRLASLKRYIETRAEDK